MGVIFVYTPKQYHLYLNIMYKNLKTIILSILIIASALSFFGAAFAEPTARDLDLRYDAKNGTTRDGYIDSFK